MRAEKSSERTRSTRRKGKKGSRESRKGFAKIIRTNYH